MDKTIKLSKIVHFTGRNGYFKAKAMNVMTISDKVVMITPVTTKGKEARCDVQIPVEDIPKLVDALCDAYNESNK